MTIHEAGRQLRFQLFHLYDEREASNITELVMEQLTGWKRIDRVVNKTVPLTPQQEQQLHTYTAALLEHKPLQYVLQEAWFYNMALYIDERVLIPRPETEELVDWLIQDARISVLDLKNHQVLDIGTGSGCIPLAIKKTLPAFMVHSCDISPDALEVAKKNAHTQQLDIHFHQLDILLPADQSSLPVVDIIISNPPYIPEQDKMDMAAHVLQYEPHLALFVGNHDPLVFYKAIAAFAKTHLHKDGWIYLEIHEAMSDALLMLYAQAGFTRIELKKDLQGKDRMMKIGR